MTANLFPRPFVEKRDPKAWKASCGHNRRRYIPMNKYSIRQVMYPQKARQNDQPAGAGVVAGAKVVSAGAGVSITMLPEGEGVVSICRSDGAGVSTTGSLSSGAGVRSV